MKLLLIEDHAAVRAGLTHLLRSALGAEVTEAADADEALDAIGRHRPDVVLLDLGLKKVGGLLLLPKLREMDLRVLVLTMHSEPIYARRAMAAGALGFLSKNADLPELLTAVKRVAEGRTFIEQRVAQDMALQRVEAGSGALSLNDRDLELLRLLAAGRSLGEMAKALGVSYKTVANTLTTVKRKVGVTSMVDLMRMAIEIGG